MSDTHGYQTVEREGDVGKGNLNLSDTAIYRFEPRWTDDVADAGQGPERR